MAHESKHGSGEDGLFLRFLHSELAGAGLLLLMTVVALVWANSPWSSVYDDLLHIKLGVTWDGTVHALTLHHWVNDGLMVVFFFVVGLEIKRELLVGHLSSVERSILPVAAALGGMVVPAALFVAAVLIMGGGPALRGWGVPMATDIAFSLGLLSIFSSRVPTALKVFLAAAAIADDIGAILVIALFYTEKVSVTALVVAVVLLAALYLVARVWRVRRLGILLALIVGVWIAVFVSGVHATVAGILVAMIVPIRPEGRPSRLIELAEEKLRWLKEANVSTASMIEEHDHLEAAAELEQHARDMQPAGLTLEHYWHPVAALLILPVFALANAGVPLGGDVLQAITSPVAMGVVLGLFVGKQIGFVLFAKAAVWTGRAALPEGVRWTQLWGVACLAGVGFTMSLFVSDLAFDDPVLIAHSKVGILLASLLSAVMGLILLHTSLAPRGEGGS